MNTDLGALTWILRSQSGVLSRAQAQRCGITASGLQHRLRPSGPWQRLLPGVYLTTTGEPSWEQRQVAALLYAGAGSLITGAAALLNYRLTRASPRVIDVLIPLERRLTSPGFVVIHRTRRMPASVVCDGPVRYAPPERAVADAVRGLAPRISVGRPRAITACEGEARAITAREGEARAIVASAVQQGRCTIGELVAELNAGPVHGSAPLRATLAEVIAGIRSVPEGDLRRLITKAGLPQPLYNPRLYLGEVFLAQPDVWWPRYGVAVEVDSREWHLSPADWEQTMARHRRMSAAGIIVVHISPRQLRDTGDRLMADIRDALRAGRPIPAITTRPQAA